MYPQTFMRAVFEIKGEVFYSMDLQSFETNMFEYCGEFVSLNQQLCSSLYTGSRVSGKAESDVK